MVDGSHLPFEDNVSNTQFISLLANSKNMMVEAELGRLSGKEDDLTVEDYEARLTDADQVVYFFFFQLVKDPVPFNFFFSLIYMNYEFQAEEFIDMTGIDALAVCIGNVHGKYPASGPNLRLELLKVKYSYQLQDFELLN